MPKNDLFLRALKGEKVDRPPVWMMRQAGRYLPEFIKLKNDYDFFTRCQTPELAAEITMQPIRRFPLDAAIIFSDILVIPQAMGLDFIMKPGAGPFLASPIKTEADINKLRITDPAESLSYVFDSIKLVKKQLNDEIPLIGFAGAPWTILCYAVEGQGSKGFEKAKGFCFSQPKLAHRLLEEITNITIEYLKLKVKAGADVIQLFDSWGGLLSPQDYDEFSLPYIKRIVDELGKLVPTIVFAKGCWFALDKMSKIGASALGVDWTLKPETARELSGGKITLQGNFDPSRLLSKPEIITEKVHQMIDGFGTDNYIANLGHGILPNVAVENAKAFVEAVVNYKKK